MRKEVPRRCAAWQEAGMEPVDLALCLAVDVSASVDYAEYGLMLGGYAAAFRDPELVAAMTAGPAGAVAVAMLFWSGTVPPPELAVPWQRLDGGTAAAAFADLIDTAARLPAAGATALGEGMLAGLTLLGRCPAPARRLVLDVSGDGRHNQGQAPGPVRDLGVAAGVTINALAILNEEPDLLAHYRAEVIGGPGAFAMECADYLAFAEAIRQKLLSEFTGGLVAKAAPRKGV